MGIDRLKQMVKKKQLKGVVKPTGQPEFCEPCVLGKMKKLPFPKGQRQKTTAPFEIVHSDVGGPVSPASPSGYRYWITFTDDHTCYPWIFYMKRKSEAFGIYKRFQADIKAVFKTQIKEIHLCDGFVEFLRTDGGGEYTDAEFEKYLREEGVVHETTAPDTPEPNGVAERMNQTICNVATAALIESGLPKTFWTEAMSSTVHVIT